MAAGARQQRAGRGQPVRYTLLTWVGAPVAVVVTSVVGGRLTWWQALGAFSILAFTPALIITWIGRAERRFASRGPRGLRLLAVTAVLAGEACAIVLVSPPGGDNKRCVSKQNMTVVPASDCRNSQNGLPASEQTVWYYGGTGAQVGTRVQGGSEEPPGEPTDNTGGGTDDENGNTSDTGGDDGGDDDGDGGGDGGGDG
jgi:hypothetical protein